MSELPAPVPVVNPETKPFWDGTAEGRLLLQRCVGCAAVVWYPRTFCPQCAQERLEWFEASGRGTVYSFTIVRRGATGPYSDAAPYVLAYVELEEGPRLLTNIVDCDVETIRIGDEVRAVFHRTGDGPALVRFRPAT
jgi:uncharacterized OB-fold protein